MPQDSVHHRIDRRGEAARPLVVWRFADGLRGHENQSDGLIAALSERRALSVHSVATPRAQRLGAVWRALLGADSRGLPNPDLLIGAGTSTQVPMLAARRRRGGRAVVLMTPSLPVAWFDLVIAPAHDRLSASDNVLVTRGALNRARAAKEKDPRLGLILIGGPDTEYAWEPDTLEAQIVTIVDRHADIHWYAAASRRTPTDFLPRLSRLGHESLSTVAVEDVDADWLPDTLARAASAWVSEDSVNMIYEALTAAAATGLLEMPRRHGGKSKRDLGGALLADGLVTTFKDWHEGAALEPPAERLDEAGRCADWILEQWKIRDR